VSIVLLLERRIPSFFFRRSGVIGKEIGVDNEDYYLFVEEKIKWGESAAKDRLKFIFRNAVKRVLNPFSFFLSFFKIGRAHV